MREAVLRAKKLANFLYWIIC